MKISTLHFSILKHSERMTKAIIHPRFYCYCAVCKLNGYNIISTCIWLKKLDTNYFISACLIKNLTLIMGSTVDICTRLLVVLWKILFSSSCEVVDSNGKVVTQFSEVVDDVVLVVESVVVFGVMMSLGSITNLIAADWGSSSSQNTVCSVKMNDIRQSFIFNWQEFHKWNKK